MKTTTLKMCARTQRARARRPGAAGTISKRLTHPHLSRRTRIFRSSSTRRTMPSSRRQSACLCAFARDARSAYCQVSFPTTSRISKPCSLPLFRSRRPLRHRLRRSTLSSRRMPPLAASSTKRLSRTGCSARSRSAGSRGWAPPPASFALPPTCLAPPATAGTRNDPIPPLRLPILRRERPRGGWIAGGRSRPPATASRRWRRSCLTSRPSPSGAAPRAIHQTHPGAPQPSLRPPPPRKAQPPRRPADPTGPPPTPQPPLLRRPGPLLPHGDARRGARPRVPRRPDRPRGLRGELGAGAGVLPGPPRAAAGAGRRDVPARQQAGGGGGGGAGAARDGRDAAEAPRHLRAGRRALRGGRCGRLAHRRARALYTPSVPSLHPCPLQSEATPCSLCPAPRLGGP